jgi:hypothetical protein
MTEETVQTPTFDQAAQSARATLSEQSKETVEVKSDDTKTETTETTEQTQAETPTEETAENNELLTKEEVATLSKEAQANYKKMQKAFTTKTQKLAADRKEVERLKKYQEIIDSFETDPEGTVKKLASQYGVTLEAPKKEPSQTKQDELNEMQAELRQLLGEENEQLADGLFHIFNKRLEAQGNTLKTVSERQEIAIREAVAASTESDLKTFEQKHPDFKAHEKVMLELSKKWMPNPSSSLEVDEYLETLYEMATARASKTATKAQQTKEVLDRINKAAASSETKDSVVSENKITPVKPKRPTMEEAFEAAKKGITW